MKMTFEELVTAAQELPAAQKAVLAFHLQRSQIEEPSRLTREQAITELEALRKTGALADVESLLGKYAHSGTQPSADELQETIRKAATEWECELDEFFNGA